MKFSFTQNSMSQNPISAIKLPLQAVDTCHTCQELSAKMYNLNMYDTFFKEYKWSLVHLAVSVNIYIIFYKFQILLTFTKTPPCIRWLL